MARYYRSTPAFWDEHREWTDRQKLLGKFLWTCKHRNLEGFYKLPKAYIAEDLNWTPAVAASTLRFLVGAGFCCYDDRAGVLLLPDALSVQAPSTEKQLAGAITALEQVPPNALWNRFLIECESHCPVLANAIRKRFGLLPDETRNGSGSHSDIARTPNSDSRSRSDSTTQVPT